MKKRLLLTTAWLLAAVGGLRAADASPPAAGGEDNGYLNIAVFTKAMQLIRQDYVDEKKVSYRALTYAALKGMFNSLDPHTRFMEPQELQGMEDETKSEFTGLGITVTVRDGTLTIISPMEDTPSSRAGLLPGDQILRINGLSTEKMDPSGAIDQLRGGPGEKITLTILRPSTKVIKDFEIVRAIIKVRSVKDAHMIDPKLSGDAKIGYVRITQFSEPTATELATQLDLLEKQGMQALVLDLRFNPGGLLDSAVDVCGQFVAPGTMVVYTEGRIPSQRVLYRTSASAKVRPRYPLAILINGGSASGSEIVAGALKDLHRAVLVGETSFGKGSVQSVLELPDGSGFRLTTARYYTPSRQIIHEKGVAPHIRATLSAEQEHLLMQKFLSGGGNRTAGNFRDTQLERAVDALKGAVLYGALQAPVAKTAPTAPAKRR